MVLLLAYFLGVARTTTVALFGSQGTVDDVNVQEYYERSSVPASAPDFARLQQYVIWVYARGRINLRMRKALVHSCSYYHKILISSIYACTLPQSLVQWAIPDINEEG